jgi:tetratricopeptide (TPR) repeat protein
MATTTYVSTSGSTTAQPSAIKGNVTAILGKLQHNPEKQQSGNAMIASSYEQKAGRFETKALDWERQGNMAKAAKNRGKAANYRQKATAKLSEPLTAPAPVSQKRDKAARCEAKALNYEKQGNLAKAQKNREKAYRIREKHNIPHPIGTLPPATYTSSTTSTYAGPVYTTAPPSV